MAFGTGFGYVAPEEKELLPDGDYSAKITNVGDNQRLQGAVDVYFAISGHPNATPYTMTLFPRPEMGSVKKNGQMITEEDLKMWDSQMSRFFDAFSIKPGDFNFNSWRGHSGWVTCRKNKNNDFKSLYVAYNQHKEPAVTTSAPQQQSAPSQVQQIASVMGGEIIKEDIPF